MDSLKDFNEFSVILGGGLKPKNIISFLEKKFKNLILFEELEYSLISVSLSENHYTLFKKKKLFI